MLFVVRVCMFVCVCMFVFACVDLGAIKTPPPRHHVCMLFVVRVCMFVCVCVYQFVSPYCRVESSARRVHGAHGNNTTRGDKLVDERLVALEAMVTGA